MIRHLAPLLPLLLLACDGGRGKAAPGGGSLGGQVIAPGEGEGEPATDDPAAGEGEGGPEQPGGEGEGDPGDDGAGEGEAGGDGEGDGEGEGDPGDDGGDGEGDGEGGDDCARNSDCEDGLTCVQGQCVEGGEGEGGEGDDPPPCPGAPGRAGVPADYGDGCQRASQCSCDLCFDEAPAGGDGVCTAYCVQDADCPGLDTCETIGNVSACVPNDVGDECRDPAQCNFGICLNDPAAGEAVCTKECDNRLECGQSFGCGIVRNQQGGDSYACVPVGGRCGAAAGCAGSRCLPDAAGGDQGYCTNDCRTSADCDIANVCCGIPGPDGCPVGVCVRGACPAECQNNQQCPPGWGCLDVDHPDGGTRNMCVNLACVGG